jgi:amino acid transporter
MSRSNSTLLAIAGGILLVLALLSLATPLIRVSNTANRAGLNGQLNRQNFPGGQNNGLPDQAFPGQGLPGNPGNLPGPSIPGQGQRNFGQGGQTIPFQGNVPRAAILLRFGFLSGITGTIVFGIALIISIVAALGMFLAKRWGQVSGVIMAVVYLVLVALAILPRILFMFRIGTGFLSIGLDILRVLLAVAVIILALLPTRKGTVAAQVDPVSPTASAG